MSRRLQLVESEPVSSRTTTQRVSRGSSATPVEMDLESWFECYLADCEARGLSERTLEWYEDRGRRIVSEWRRAGVLYPDDLSRRSVSLLMTSLRRRRRHGKALSPQTLKGYWQIGKGFATFLIAEEALDRSNPFDQFGKPRVPEKSMWAPSREECAAMLKAPDRKTERGLRDALILQLLLDTGLRVSALVRITLSDLDFKQRHICVVEKGSKERTIPFGAQTHRWLRRYVVAAGLDERDPLFPGRNGGPMSRRSVDDIIKACALQARVRAGKVSAHDLRRAFAREFLRNGGDLESLRQLLGHSSYAMVKRYAELASEVVAETYRRASPGDRIHQ